MADDKETVAPSPGMQSDVWDYVRRRNELDREIQEKFARPVTIMFTDIKGSTTFFDMRGDLEGVTMLQRHNELVVPPIEENGGRILQRLGDGLLATFPTATPGVKAGIEIQKRLHEYNGGSRSAEQIHVRVGLNSGMGLVEESNVFGDAVNTAARVQTLAEPGQILVSDSTYQEARKDSAPTSSCRLAPPRSRVSSRRSWSSKWCGLRTRPPARGRRGPRPGPRGAPPGRLACGRASPSASRGGRRRPAAAAEVEELAYDEARWPGGAAVEAMVGGADRDGRVPSRTSKTSPVSVICCGSSSCRRTRGRASARAPPPSWC